MHVEVTFVLVGLLGLTLGADFLVKGIKNIADSFGFSEFFVGLAIVGVATNIPEISVSIAGAFQNLSGVDASGIVVGTALGSALSLLGLLFGLFGILLPPHVAKSETLKQAGFFVASVILYFGLGADGSFSRTDGFILIAAYIVYQLVLWFSETVLRDHDRRAYPFKEFVTDAAYFLFGIGLVVLSSRLVVSNAALVAEQLGVAQTLIGIFLVGIGTELPELSVMIASLRRRTPSISVGNLIGSGICVLLLATGIGAAISGLAVVPSVIIVDLPVLLVLSLVFSIFLFTKGELSRWEGSILLGLFIVYSYVKFFITG